MRFSAKKLSIILLLILVFIAPTHGIKICVAAGEGSDAQGVALVKDLKMGTFSSFSGNTLIGDRIVADSWYARSSDPSSISSMMYSGDNALKISLISAGPMGASASGVAGSHAVATDLSGRADGDQAQLRLSSESPNNNQYLMAGYEGGDGEDGLKANLRMAAAGSSGISGDLEVMGVKGLEGGMPGEMAMVLNGLYAKPDGDLGRFAVATMDVNNHRDRPEVSSASTVSGTYSDYNDPQAYALAGWRWQDNPSIKFWLRTDRYLSGEKLTAGQATAALSSAAEAWDDQTGQELFANGISTSSTKAADRLDGFNVHAFKYISSGALAYSRTYYYPSLLEYDPQGRPYYRAAESDIVYNTKYSWTTSISNTKLYPATKTFYLQTVAQHELGHTCGLGDTYLDALYKYDLAQIMGFYNDANDLNHDGGVDFGAGDVTGIKQLYGS